MGSSKQITHPETEKIFGEALAHHQAGRLDDAGRLYRHILSLEPQHADSLHLTGVIRHRRGEVDAAITSIRQAIGLRNNVPIYHNNLANALKDQGSLDEAVEHYTYALALKPDFAEAHYNLGCVFRDQGKLKEAVMRYERAIALQPGFVSAYINLGNTVRDQGQFEEAIRHYEHALSLEPSSAEAHYNLGTALKDLSQFKEAQTHYERALAFRPNYVEAHNNLGVLLRDQGQLNEALRHFQMATAIKPDHAESHVNEAMTLLLSGDLTAGWQKYQWRWRMKGVKPFETDKPLWDGQDLRGKTILLHGEQGLGDCIQFVRYASLLKERGGRILFLCPPALSRLFKGMNALDHIVPEGNAVPGYDCHAPLLDLPRLFSTTLETIPNSVPYLFASSDQIALWAERLGCLPGLKVGLVWAGNSRLDHRDAHAADRRRSMPLAQFAPLGTVPGVRFFSLQKGDAARQLEIPVPGLEVIDYMNHVEDFADTAAFTTNLDLVIGVDTSVVHLAGAMGKPVWVLSRFDGCWRWLLNREDNPWYPSLRLFRQPSEGDWPSVVEHVRVALAHAVKLPGRDIP